MTTWTTVNLPWAESAPIIDLLPPEPTAPFQRRDLCDGVTWEEFDSNHYSKQRAIWDREGIEPGPGHQELSHGARNEIELNRLARLEVLQRIWETPEMLAWCVECQKIREAHKASYFSNKIEVGMLLEFADGKRLLVGDMASDGTLGGCCRVDVEEGAIVVRYTRVTLPE